MEPIIGIDFGTTNSAVAFFSGTGPVVLSNDFGESILPSAVHIAENGDIHVGQSARNVRVLHVDETILSVKREIGMGGTHVIHGKEYTTEKIASYILRSLRETAEKRIGQDIRKAVVTVPAYFDDRRRQAVKEVAQLAGLEVARLVNEPTAAALAYGVDNRSTGFVLVYDLGGGTFDVSVLSIQDGVFQVCATRGDTRLGGDDFDREIVRLLLERFEEENGIDLSGDGFALQKLHEEAERAKKCLSEKRVAEMQVPFISADDRGPLHLNMRLTRNEFEELIMGYIEKTIRLTRAALKDAGLRPVDIDDLLLVGGSTRIPLVRQLIGEIFIHEPEQSLPPEEAVALGAAVQAGILSGDVDDMVLVDVTPLGLGVENQGGIMVTMIPRNTVLPVRMKTVFTTVQDLQKAATIHVLQGERPRTEGNISLGAFTLQGIRRASKGKPQIEVCFDIDVEGIVHVSAEDLDTGCSYAVHLNRAFDLSEQEISNILLDSQASELEDLRYEHERKMLMSQL